MSIVRCLSFGDRPPLHLLNRIMRDTLLNLPEHFSVPSDGHSLHLLSFYPLSAVTASSPQRQQS